MYHIQCLSDVETSGEPIKQTSRVLIKPQITITEDSSTAKPQISITKDKNKTDSTSNPKITITEDKGTDSTSERKGKCPLYFGIRSYIHNFYDVPDKDYNDGQYGQDDFEFLVEPGKRRWKGCWFRTGLWVGVNLILLGLIALLVGHLTPVRNTIVGHQNNLEILDRWAIAFNRRLELCKLGGLTAFCVGGLVVMVTLLVSSYQPEATYVIGSSDAFTTSGEHRIPITGSVRSVQPFYIYPKVK
uniref:Neurensin-1 n=1 Tax=Clastoptera arizonana TaxID=38151 RepID=A0A1B6CUW5_9HEMI